jgi:hypothetical protein
MGVKSYAGTRLSQPDYEQLEEAATLDGYLTDAEARILINDEFGFEVSRIKIMREAEIDVTKDGDRQVTLERVPRRAVYRSTDWNYIRFNVRGCAGEWYYEMVDGQLNQVYL